MKAILQVFARWLNPAAPSQARLRDVKAVLHVFARWLCLPLVLAGSFLLLQHVQHSNWYKQRLYQQLLCGDAREQLKAASALAHFGGEEQLLAGLKEEAPAVRDLARRALECLWFRAAGSAAHEGIEKAFQAAEKKDFQTALSILDGVIQKHPNYAEAWNSRASVYWQADQCQKSIADCEKTLALNPNHYGAWQGMGVCRVQLGDIAEACRCLRASLKIAPYDESTRKCLEKCEELLRVMKSKGEEPRPRDFI